MISLPQPTISPYSFSDRNGNRQPNEADGVLESRLGVPLQLVVHPCQADLLKFSSPFTIRLSLFRTQILSFIECEEEARNSQKHRINNKGM